MGRTWREGILFTKSLGKNPKSILWLLPISVDFILLTNYSTVYARENEFEDGKHFYRFLEHEPFVLKCYNFRGSTNDNEPKDVAVLGQRLGKIMSALLESYASDDRHHIDYIGISNSEEFRRYLHFSFFFCQKLLSNLY